MHEIRLNLPELLSTLLKNTTFLLSFSELDVKNGTQTLMHLEEIHTVVL